MALVRVSALYWELAYSATLCHFLVLLAVSFIMEDLKLEESIQKKN